jgi:hypothetical protein
MIHSSFHLPAVICVALAISAAPATAQTAGGTANLSGGKVKVGVLTDIAGPTALANGKGSVIAAEMAAEDFGAGLNVEVISADHSGKPDVGSQIAARWFDVEGVDAIADMQGSSIGFAVQNMAAQRSKIMLLSGSTSSDFSGKACSPLTVQWTVDTYNLAKTAAKSVTEAGGTKWYFLTVDQAYGHALSRDTSEQVKLNGGQVVGNSVFPPNTSDFASFLLTASNAGANVIAIAASSGDTVTTLKQADEFGLSAKDRAAPVGADGRLRGRPEDSARRLRSVSLLLGPHTRDARLGRALLRESEDHADRISRRRLLVGLALPQGRESDGHRRRSDCDEADGEGGGARLLRGRRLHSRRPQDDPRHVPAPGEEAR